MLDLLEKTKTILFIIVSYILTCLLLSSCATLPESVTNSPIETSPGWQEELPVPPTKVVELRTANPTVLDQSPTSTPEFAFVRYSGVEVKPDRFLFVMVREKEQESDFFQVLPENPVKPELVATVKGLVYHFSVHTDLLGFDYAVGEREEESDPIYHQLFSYRFSETQAKLVTDFEKDTYAISWSYDGQYLAVIQAKDVAAPNLVRSLFIVNLSCRKIDHCTFQEVQTQWNLDPYRAVWAPHAHQVAFVGRTLNPFGTRDVFITSLDQKGQLTKLTNLTNSDEVEELNPQWLPGGVELLFACAKDLSPNEYNLCHSNVPTGETQELRRLPYNMKDFTVSPSGEVLYDFFYSEQPPSLRMLHIAQPEAVILIENVEIERYPLIAVSADGKTVGFIEKGGKQVMMLAIPGRQKESIKLANNGYVSWIQWIRSEK